MKKTNLIIFPGNFLPHIGGLETHVDEFAKYLSKNGKYSITIFVPNVVNAKEKETIHNGVKVIRYPAIELVANWPLPKIWSLRFWELFLSLYNKRYDIVMTRTRFFSNSSLGMFFAKFRLRRLKLIHVEHGSEYVKVESRVTNFISYLYDRIFGNMIFHIADNVIGVSEAAANFIRREFLKKKEVLVIRRGIDFSKYDDVKPDAQVLKKFKGKIKIVIVTRLYKWKGVPNIIRAYRSLPDEMRKRCVFLIGGYGEDEQRIRKEAGKYLDDGIYMYGKIPFEKAAALMKASDIYVHSSYPGGGQSSSLLMGMYCSCSVIASPHEGAAETLAGKDAGILLKNNSASSIKNAIVKLVKDEKLRKSNAHNAHKLLLKDYAWDDVIMRYDELFDEVMERK